MTHDKIAQLDSALEALHKRFGTDAVRLLKDAVQLANGFQTGFPDLDILLPHGIPRGHVTELLGRPSSGMTTLAYRILHQAQGKDGLVLYIDLDATFDPVAARACGLWLDRLLIARPQDNYETLEIAQAALSAGHALIIAFDLGSHQPDEDRLRRLIGALTATRSTALVMMNPKRGISESPAALRLLIEHTGWLRAGRDVIGCQARVTVLKQRAGTAGAQALMPIIFGGENP